ncbi:MAG: phage integrase N-terminal SAM-like domain-containing protein [Lentisphaeria bacterium]|nr:phage integrase N-terminal SAM-like domain-containing protein [Lentisphaeria bacterium]
MGTGMYGNSGQMTGLGTSHLYGELVCELIGACAKALYAAGRAIGKRAVGEEPPASEPKEFRAMLVASGYAPSTARKYEACVLRFLATMGHTKLSYLRDDDVYAYLESLVGQGLGNASLRLHLCAVRAVFDNMLGMRITAGIVHVPRPALRPAATEQELELLRRTCMDPQTRLAIDMLNRMGVRPGVLVSLALTPPTDEEQQCNDISLRLSPFCFPGKARVNWLFPSPVRPGPISLRTLQRRLARLGASLKFPITCTAIRKAGEAAIRAA